MKVTEEEINRLLEENKELKEKLMIQLRQNKENK